MHQERTMKIITLRNIPSELQHVIEARARKTGSLNKTIIAMLEEAAGIHPAPKRRRQYRDLSHLAGRWTREEADAFDKALREIRTVDPEFWDK
jgi:hypothetical protein